MPWVRRRSDSRATVAAEELPTTTCCGLFGVRLWLCNGFRARGLTEFLLRLRRELEERQLSTRSTTTKIPGRRCESLLTSVAHIYGTRGSQPLVRLLEAGGGGRVWADRVLELPKTSRYGGWLWNPTSSKISGDNFQIADCRLQIAR